MLLLLLPTIGRSEDWQKVIEDTFTATPPARAPGSALASTSPEKGGGVWRHRGNDARFQFSPEGTITSGNICGGKSYAWLDCLTDGKGQIKLEVDLRPGGSQWLAAGFSKSADLFWSTGQLWITVGGSRVAPGEGVITVYANGVKIALKNIKATDYGFDRTKPVHTEIVYDTDANALSLLLNGNPALTHQALGSFKPQIEQAGIMVNFPEPNDPLMMVDNFRVSLKGGVLRERPVSTQPVIVIDSTAVKRTNLGWGLPSYKNGETTIALLAETSLEPTAPYFAEFDFALNPGGSGDYDCWALVLACNEPWMSEWTWQLDGAKAQRGIALEGSLAGSPRWVKFGKVKLEAGPHQLRFDVVTRRSFPDDAYVFHLWKVILSPSTEPFDPSQTNVELGYNPQGNASDCQSGQAGDGTKKMERTLALRSTIADPVEIKLDLKKTLPPVAPIWLDYSECELLNWHIPYLIKPLRPRIIRAQHLLSGSIKKFDPTGKPDYDFTTAHNVIKAIRSYGAEPLVGLDNPPTQLYPKENGKMIPVAEWANNKAFRKAWSETVTAFFQSLKGDPNLAVHYAHCFNEPEFSYKDSGASIMLHQVAAQAVKDCDPSVKMFGIGFGNAKSGVYFDFLKALEKDSKNLDYFDYHQYQTTPAMHAQLLKDLRSDLDKRRLERIKIAVTEWGITSSGKECHRVGVRVATQNASCIKAMAETGLVDIANLFNLRDYDNNGMKFGLITWDGYLRPSYWGQWLWAQLPETGDRLEVNGGDDRIQSFAFRDGKGLAILIWYDSPENAPLRKVILKLDSESWTGYVARQWQLDATRHIGYIPEGTPVELPYSLSSKVFEKPTMPVMSFNMLPASMRLIKLQPLAAGEDPPPPRPTLLDNPDYYLKKQP